MTAWLVRKFIKNYESVTDPHVRTAYGTLASITGVFVNLLLAAGKFLMGIISGSLAITADAANNLSDAAGSIVTLISVRLAQKPVDVDHPFGHGRMEYLGSLGVGVLIVVMGVSLLRDSIVSILHPAAPLVSWIVIAVLVLSMLVKVWLFLFYRTMGGKTANGTLLAASKDSLGDVLSTGAVLLSVACNLIFGWSIDGWIGLLVSFIVLKAGYEVCKDTVDSLLGGRPDPDKIRQLRELLLSQNGIEGVHDLVLHDYGPGRCFASVHAEVDARGNILEIHELVDDAEREIGQKMNMPICIHMDPIITDDEETNRMHNVMHAFLLQTDANLSMHDFRIVPGENHTNLIFDCVLPAGYREREKLLQTLSEYAHSVDPRYRLVVTFDTDYT